MRYRVTLAASERKQFADLIGQRLDYVRTDGWSALLRFGDTSLQATPEEAATPDAAHPYGDVHRPSIQVVQGRNPMDSGQPVIENAGFVHAVNIISILISFSPVVDYAEEEIRPGVALPASKGYGWIYYPPALVAEAEMEAGAGNALVELDIAFELVTEFYPSIVFYTAGYFLCVSTDGLPEVEDWVKVGSFERLPLRSDHQA